VPSGWFNEAPEDLLRKAPPLEEHVSMNADGFIAIVAPENTTNA
jgi:hypothetical protein